MSTVDIKSDDKYIKNSPFRHYIYQKTCKMK